jgi:Photosynthesis system II assembly factor YCF48
MTARSDKSPEKAMDGVLRETLRQTAPSSTDCPDAEMAAAYFERSLDDREIAEYDLHLSQCALCREQQAVMTSVYAPAGRIEDEKPGWAWLWDWRWLAPAMAVLAVAVIWYARRPEMSAGRSGEPPYLAMSRSTEQPNPATPDNKPAPSAPREALRAEREESGSKAIQAQAPAEKAQDLAGRGSANELASNLEADAVKKDSDASDSGPVSGLKALPPAAPAPVPPLSSAAARQNEGADAPFPIAEAKTKQAEALTSRNRNLAIAKLRSTGTLIRTPNPRVVWRIGTEGLVERSTDGGTAWTAQSPSAGAEIIAGSAPTEKTCWIVGRSGVILVTTNATDWKTIQPPAKVDFAAIVAQDASIATVTTADGHKFATRDGGESWSPAP